MGEVYRARDERLDRFVAIKILPAERSTNRDAIARFEREARAASALNHPHILHVYDIGTAQLPAHDEPVHFIAMELIEGDTLRGRFDSGTEFRHLLEPLIDVAKAMAKAHAAGIIHRDLKPENIMISRDGYAKVLDFGLAKLVDGGPPHDVNSDDATQQMARTSSGMVLGTAGYMSPEQVEGRPADARSDIFSFGCILHEAISKTRAFHGRSAVDTMHQILHDEPSPVTPLPNGVPPEILRVARKCLAKDAEQRYQNIKEVAVDLREVRRLSEIGVAPILAGRKPPNSWKWIAAVVAAIALAMVIFTLSRREPAAVSVSAPEPFAKIDIERVTFTGDVIRTAISPGGRYLAYVRDSENQTSLWLKQFATATDVQLLGAGELDIRTLTFSPDEDYIYFTAKSIAPNKDDDLYRIPVIGGPERKIVHAIRSSISFAPDGKRFAYFQPGVSGKSNLVAASMDGSNPQALYTGSESIFAPAWSPDGKEIICETLDESRSLALSVIDLRQRTLRVLHETNGEHFWMPDGKGLITPRTFPEPVQQIRYLPYPRGKERRITTDLSHYLGASMTRDGRTIASAQMQRSKSIWVLPGGNWNSAKQLTPSVPGRSDGSGGISWASDGTLVYTSMDREIRIVSLSADEKDSRILISEPFTSSVRSPAPAISPDGKQIAYTSHADGGIWLMDRDGGDRRRLTKGSGDFNPQWLADGSGILYS